MAGKISEDADAGVLAGTELIPVVDAGVNATTTPDTIGTRLAAAGAVRTALDLKAPLASPALTGVPTAPTASAATNTTQIASTAMVQAAIAALIASAPGVLDTLDELAAALGDDANYAATIATALALKAPLASPALTGDPTAPTPGTSDNDTSIATTAMVQAAVDADVATHAALTATHGATGAVVGTTNAQTLTNKTLIAPELGIATATSVRSGSMPGSDPNNRGHFVSEANVSGAGAPGDTTAGFETKVDNAGAGYGHRIVTTFNGASNYDWKVQSRQSAAAWTDVFRLAGLDGAITLGVWKGTAIAVANGGTGAGTSADARTNLGLVIGTNVQAWNPGLDAATTAWTAFTPSFGFTGGTTPAATSPVGWYKLVGKTLHMRIESIITYAVIPETISMTFPASLISALGSRQQGIMYNLYNGRIVVAQCEENSTTVGVGGAALLTGSTQPYNLSMTLEVQ